MTARATLPTEVDELRAELAHVKAVLREQSEQTNELYRELGKAIFRIGVGHTCVERESASYRAGLRDATVSADSYAYTAGFDAGGRTEREGAVEYLRRFGTRYLAEAEGHRKAGRTELAASVAEDGATLHMFADNLRDGDHLKVLDDGCDA